MKKLLVLSLAVVMVIAFTLPASALESVFGGYWRTRAVSQQNFSGVDTATPGTGTQPSDLSQVDTRTRLYYTAILNDNLKFVNQFEFDAVWGGTGNYGDIGADGVNVEIRASYIDATMGAIRATIGAQPWEQARGFIFSDIGSGVILSTKMGEHLLPFAWIRANEGSNLSRDNNSEDSDVFAFYPVFNFGDNFSLNPFITFGYSKDGERTAFVNSPAGNWFSSFGANGFPAGFDPSDGFYTYWLGANVDATLGSFNLWATAIYQGGEYADGDAGTTGDLDISAYLAAFGGNVPLGPASLHGQFFYASGDDDPGDTDLEAFFGVDGGAAGWSYYWAEIMGNGRFDNALSAGSTANPSNIWAANIGATIKPMEKLSLRGDVWYASLVEDNLLGDKDLGIEVDLVATYQLIEGLSIDLVGAYLFAGDATTAEGFTVGGQSNEDDPWEVGTRLQISF
jgi:hypothetical protein